MADAATSPPTSQPHYPLTTRILLDLYTRGELPAVQALDIEPTYGYVGRVLYDNGAVRMFRRTNVGVNNHGASEMSKDKGYTKYFLQRLGFQTPPGRVFLAPSYQELIDSNLSRYGFSDYHRLDDIYSYIEQFLGYPVFVKPNDESQGKGVEMCRNAAAVDTAIQRNVRAGHAKLLVEQYAPGNDYRVVVFGGRVVCAYQRVPLAVVGDGVASVQDLLRALAAEQFAAGRGSRIDPDDPRLANHLQATGRTLASVLADGERLPLADIANLTAGGAAVEMSEAVHPRWARLCIDVTRQLGLRLCGVDLACADLSDPAAPYSIIETNASPGLDNYAALGPAAFARVEALYRDIFAEAPAI